MTLCNMSIEAGARAGMVAPDETTFAYLKGRAHAPVGEAWDAAVAYWRTLPGDEGATFDKEVVLDAAAITPHVTWGTNPAQVAPIAGLGARPRRHGRPRRARGGRAGARLHGAQGRARRMREIPVDTVFLGSLHQLADRGPPGRRRRARGPHVRPGLRALAVPGSHRVKAQAESRGPRQGLRRRRASSGASRAAPCAWP